MSQKSCCLLFDALPSHEANIVRGVRRTITMLNFTIRTKGKHERARFSFEFVGAFFVKYWSAKELQRKQKPQDAELLRAKKRHSTLITINILCVRCASLWRPVNKSKYLNVRLTMSGLSVAFSSFGFFFSIVGLLSFRQPKNE